VAGKRQWKRTKSCRDGVVRSEAWLIREVKSWTGERFSVEIVILDSRDLVAYYYIMLIVIIIIISMLECKDR